MIYTADQIQLRMIELGMILPNFHLVAIRSKGSIPDKFDDLLYVIGEGNRLGISPFTCTTNPGKNWLEKLLNPLGTPTIVADKQYINSHCIGKHKGNPALVQCGAVWVTRDNDNDGINQIEGKPEYIAKPECKINIHGTYKKYVSIFIGGYSAGCIVLNNPEEFDVLMALCEASAKGMFTLTVLNEFEA